MSDPGRRARGGALLGVPISQCALAIHHDEQAHHPQVRAALLQLVAKNPGGRRRRCDRERRGQ